MPLTPAQDNILKTMKVLDRPVTVKDIANHMSVTSQTVRNHMGELLRIGRVKYSEKYFQGTARIYVLADIGSTGANPISWKAGEMTTIREIFESLGAPGADFSPNSYWRNMEIIIVKLYQIGLAALDNDNPQMPNAMELREFRRVLEQILESAGNVRSAVMDLLAFEELWQARDLPKVLILNDTKLDVERATDIIDRINK